MRTTIFFDNFGPYHYARLLASARTCELTAVQISRQSAVYAWENEDRATSFKVMTLFSGQTSGEVGSRELARKIFEALDQSRPEVVFIPGWSSRAALAALLWCTRNAIPAVAMSESTEWDEKRVGWKEGMKRKIVGLYTSSLVGGQPHADYMIKLGMPAERISLGYDVVDNDYFATQAGAALNRTSEVRKEWGLPDNYFLASARFVEKKNLPRLLQAYARYRHLAGTIGLSKPWPLILLGDGPSRPLLEKQIASLNLQGEVFLPGFKQYSDLPTYYALASAFIHASTVEQWGLVVNEAMASGLPVLVSQRCGCASELVQKGRNGFTFDPYDIERLAGQIHHISSLDLKTRQAMGAESVRIISEWSPQRFADGLNRAALAALESKKRKGTWFDQLLLQGLLLK